MASPAQVIPITGIADAGVVVDTPSVSLPPNVFSDVANIRFHDGAARKMEGEEEISISSVVLGPWQYIAFWEAANGNYYVAIDSSNVAPFNARIIIQPEDLKQNPITRSVSTLSATSDAVWQHTAFNGGFNLILNNGIDPPHYLADPDAINDSVTVLPLPNWDSYLAQEEVTTVVWDEFNNMIDLGREIDFNTESLLYTVTPRDASIGIINYLQSSESDALKPYTLNLVAGNYNVVPRGRTDTMTGALPGDQVKISVQTDAAIQVRAGVIRTYGNLLIAGNLTEVDADDNSITIRRLPGTIRTSDVAAPGAVPLNWNPFRNGANTADEFILSSTGVIKDLVELQGVMYVYTDVSIHGIQQTGNPTLPFQISTVTDSYGANSIGSVIEVDGRHVVVGSDDVYIFGGHPGSITSIADGLVRHYIANLADLEIGNIRMVRSQRYDEIWIFTPEIMDPDAIPLNEMLVWNYRKPAWTKRVQSNVVAGNDGPVHPIFATQDSLFAADVIGKYTLYDNTPYESFIERDRLALTPEFDTETLQSTALMLTTGIVDPDDPTKMIDKASLEVAMRGSEIPSDSLGAHPDIPDTRTFVFDGPDDYKVDSRIHGRFLNYRISDNITSGIGMQSLDWNLTGFQFEIMKGGKR